MSKFESVVSRVLPGHGGEQDGLCGGEVDAREFLFDHFGEEGMPFAGGVLA
jgi:hypothetical protein